VKNKRIFFIVDDDPDDQEIFINAIHSVEEFCVCNGAFNGEDAIRQLSELYVELPELIFLDLNMPKMDGKQCLAKIKALKKLQNIPVIIYSTSADKKEIAATYELGASFFLQKPNRFEELYKAVEKIITHDWSSAL
jgi:CheY-like chemotaxis protein